MFCYDESRIVHNREQLKAVPYSFITGGSEKMGRSIPKSNNNRAVLSLRPLTERITIVKCSLDSWGDPIEISRVTAPASIKLTETDSKTTATILLRSDVNVNIADAVEYNGSTYQVVSVVAVRDMNGGIVNIRVTAR